MMKRPRKGGTDSWNSLAKSLEVGFGVARTGEQRILLEMRWARGRTGNVSCILAVPPDLTVGGGLI